MNLTVEKYRVKSVYTEHEDTGSKYYGYLSTLGERRNVNIDINEALSYRGDFIGLMRANGVHDSLHKITMYINNIPSSMAYNGQRDLIFINDDKISKLLATLK